ncbi:Alpha/beta hydrolase family [Mycobacteroides abscessus subsp. abscessus]|nr:Alpha/beta hydrolase family [Mycobacteroides abscessus subsp. bolletii]SLF33990.1 Alpha/beta hydrolase family [Mycobacteroides abscessus subsp. abscessus]SHR68335.1 Alpha/beta hydrolase family [Mycobacteroides abscessus subsp. bolletii]SHS15511.1 Alpha/beta hydrolase family [Mycobacteroides abscessus subsp. bolletii]SKF76214.1 Alpha/beta hydrolase family [Mycobacteroides abscessus subsp. bolletii]
MRGRQIVEFMTNATTYTPQQDAMIDELISGFARAFRSPVLGTPADEGLAYEDVFFPAEDGVGIEGWFIPREGSDKIIIANHPLWFSRTGLPAHLEPWRSIGGAAGNDFEVKFLPDYKILHDAGYNVLAYDLRNLGQSDAANGGLQSNGIYESRDVIGSLNYVRNRPGLAHMTIGLFSRCMGGSATIFAMQRRPEVFKGVRAVVMPQPLSPRVNVEMILTRLMGMPERLDEVDRRMELIIGRTLAQLSPVAAAAHVNVPTFLYQVHDDVLTQPEDVQSIYDAIPVEKELLWIQNTTRRWDGYLEFQRRPEPMLAWFERYMK